MNKTIKVLHVVPALETGGIETLLFNLYEVFDKDKFEFSFISHKNTGLIFDKLNESSENVYFSSSSRFSLSSSIESNILSLASSREP